MSVSRVTTRDIDRPQHQRALLSPLCVPPLPTSSSHLLALSTCPHSICCLHSLPSLISTCTALSACLYYPRLTPLTCTITVM